MMFVRRRYCVRFATILFGSVGLLIGLTAPGRAHGQMVSDDASSNNAAVEFGIDGLYRVGRWTGVRLRDTTIGPDAASLNLLTRDGGSIPCQFETSLTDIDAGNDRAGASDEVWGYARSGTPEAPLRITTDDNVLFDGRFPDTGSLNRRPTVVDELTSWVAVLGDTLAIDRLGVDVIRKEPMVAVSKVNDASMMPDRRLGLDGLDLLILGPDCLEWIGAMTTDQQTAVVQWLRGGGRALLMMGDQSSAMVKAAPWLSPLLPFDATQTVELSPSGFETFTASQTPLQPFVGVRLPKADGEILVRGRTTRRLSAALASRFTVGFGKITVVAADLGSENFASWPQRMDLVRALTGDILRPDNRPTSASGSQTYNDLAGQLRESMDQYDSAVRLNFSFLAIVVLALIALIGPLDYWLVNRILGRPLLGWISFPVTVIAASVALVLLANSADPTPVEHRVEVLDIDVSDRDKSQHLARLTTIAQLYGRDAVRVDAVVRRGPWIDDSDAKPRSSFLCSHGYPGSAFGGVRLTSEQNNFEPYRVQLPASDEAPLVSQLPFPPRSSQGLVSELSFAPPIDGPGQNRGQRSGQDSGQRSGRGVFRRRGSELLEGSITNPLPVDLLDGRLIYKNWVYLLPTRFAAGATIASVDSLRQKNFRWLLTRQKALESSSQSEAWRSSEPSTSRIVEMMLYHGAAGGQDYTGLSHRPLGHLDLSRVLDEDRCLLVGNVADPIGDLEYSVSQTSQPMTLRQERTSVVRVVLPAVYPQEP